MLLNYAEAWNEVNATPNVSIYAALNKICTGASITTALAAGLSQTACEP
ncbi:MAG: RagB/SusD family nutrient uptake outer membrane protein [Bacteroidetes bacterium]|nr:RagB/SusD family nutrient uptake outer membrane protein [Bacteroidota bacterium]